MGLHRLYGATRKTVNSWIRTSGAYDGVIDFDKVVRDPSDPTRFWPIYTVDGIHPNDAGNELMANAIDTGLFELFHLPSALCSKLLKAALITQAIKHLDASSIEPEQV